MKLAFSIAALAAFGVANAAVIFDSSAFTGTTIRDNDTPALHILNTNGFDMHVGNAAFVGVPDNGATQDFDFFLADGNGNILNEVHQTIFGAGLGLYGTNVNWTLQAGHDYFIGAAFDGRNNQFGYNLNFDTQNGLQSEANGNFTNGLAFEGTAGAEMSWVLNGEGTPVPEPASMAALGLGVAAMIRRRRASK